MTTLNANPTNSNIVGLLERIADLLEVQDANPYRVRAYRIAAENIRRVMEPIAIVTKGDPIRLQTIPGVGKRLASTIAEYIQTGYSSVLERLEGEVSPEDVFARIPGLGEELAHRIVTMLEIDTLEELEMAAYDGRLETVPGFGPRRLWAVRNALAGLLGRTRRTLIGRTGTASRVLAEEYPAQPPAWLVLSLDAEYRRKAEAGALKTIAPRRFNPDREAWLPIMHQDRSGWSMTAVYSNSALAHELGKTRDWVVVYAGREGEESQCTVVTAHSGPLRGLRVIRGREDESAEFYAAQRPVAPPPERRERAA